MFKLAIKDSLGAAKKHYVIFSLIVILLMVVSEYQMVSEIKELSVEEFSVFKKGLFLIIDSFLYAVILLMTFVLYNFYNKRQQVLPRLFVKSCISKLLSVLMLMVFMIILVECVSWLAYTFLFFDVVSTMKLFEIYEYFFVESTVVVIIFTMYICFYICLKLFFAVMFTMIDRKISFSSVWKSIKNSHKLIKYKDIIKISIAILAFYFVIWSVARFISEVLELFLSTKAIEFFKMGQFNSFAFIYMYINNAVCVLAVLFVMSYSKQLYDKFFKADKVN